MTLSIAATAHSHWQHLKPALTALGWDETQSDPEQWEPGKIAQGQDSHGTYLLLHTRPELALVRALAAGEPLEQAFSNWNATTDRLMAFHQTHRKQAALVDVAAAGADPQALIDWLAQNHPAFSDTDVTANLENGPVAEPPNPMLLLVVTQFLSNIPDLDLKLGRLEAMSVPLDEEGYVAPTVDLSGALQNIQQLQNTQSTLQTRVADLEKQVKETEASAQEHSSERESQLHLLEHQIHQMQEELEKAEQEKINLKQQQQSQDDADQLKQELKRVQDKLKITEDTYTKDLEDARAENKLLILQLHQVQEEMEEQYLREQKLNDELKTVKAQLEQSDSQREREQKTNDQKVQQLAAQKDELEVQLSSLENRRQDLEIHLGDIKKHLALTQNELQASHARASQQQTKISENNRKLQKLSDAKNAAQKEVSGLKRRLKAAEHQQRVLSEELEQLRKSVSWRLSSPVRAISGAVKLAHKPYRQHKTLVEQASLLENSSLFDAGWYLEKYPDVASEPMSPAQHYLAHGAPEGRDPSEQFSTRWYLKKYKDVAQSGMNPLLHYLLYGKEEGRKPSPNVNA